MGGRRGCPPPNQAGEGASKGIRSCPCCSVGVHNALKAGKNSMTPGEHVLAFLDDKEVEALMEWNAFIQTKTVERDPMLISNVHGNCCCNARDDVITCRMFQTMTALLGALPGSQEQIASTGYHHASNEIGRIGFAFYGTNWTWCVLGIMG